MRIRYSPSTMEVRMIEDNDNYLIESISEQLLLILWTSLSTLVAVGVILAVAL
jgi:hypothetical protein